MTSTREPLMTVDDPLFAGEGEIVPADDGRTVRAYCMMPSSVLYRFKAIVVAERRTFPVVMQRCVEDFLASSQNEPRPYIPFGLSDEKRVKMYYSLPSTTLASLRDRATSEGRELPTLFLRAMLDYCQASPDDPVKVQLSKEASP